MASKTSDAERRVLEHRYINGDAMLRAMQQQALSDAIRALEPERPLYGVTRSADVPMSLAGCKITPPTVHPAPPAPLSPAEAYESFRGLTERYVAQHAPKAAVITDFNTRVLTLEIRQGGHTVKGSVDNDANYRDANALSLAAALLDELRYDYLRQ